MIQQSKFFVSTLFGLGRDIKSARSVLQQISASEKILANISEHPHSDSTIGDHSFLNFINVLGVQTDDGMFSDFGNATCIPESPDFPYNALSSPRNCYIVFLILSLHFCTLHFISKSVKLFQ